MDTNDERRQFAAEMREESRTERELFCMAAILDGACMDRLAQMYDFDDFEPNAAGILEEAINDEAGGAVDDAAYCRMASEFIDDAIAEFLGVDMAPASDHERAAKVEPMRCSKCQWVHESDSIKGTSFQGVQLCPLHASAPDLLESIARLKPYGDGVDDCPPDGDDAMRVLNYWINEARAIIARQEA